MPKGRATGHDVMAMILCGVDPAWRTAALRVLSLHTGDPFKGDQTTAEATFKGYARRSILANSFWMRNDWGGYTNSQRVMFPMSQSRSSELITHVAMGIDLEGPGQVLYVSKLAEPFVVKYDDVVSIPPHHLNFTEL